MSRYRPTKTQGDTEGHLPLCLSRWTRAKTRFIGAVVGNIIAIIMTTQIARNNVAPIPIVKPMPILFIMLDCQISMTHDAAARISSSARKRGCSRCKRIVLPPNVPHHAPQTAHTKNEQERAGSRNVTRPARPSVTAVPKPLPLRSVLVSVMVPDPSLHPFYTILISSPARHVEGFGRGIPHVDTSH